MTDLDVTLDDLALNAGEAAGSELNGLADEVKQRVASAMSQGGELEVRVRLARPCRYDVWLWSPSGESVLITTIEHSVGRPGH